MMRRVSRPNPNAAIATMLESLPDGEVKTFLTDWDSQFQKWRKRWWLPFFGMRTALMFAREQAAVALQAYQELLIQTQASSVRESFGADYSRLVQSERDLRSFLVQHFEREMKTAEGRNTPVLEVAKEIMLRGR